MRDVFVEVPMTADQHHSLGLLAAAANCTVGEVIQDWLAPAYEAADAGSTVFPIAIEARDLAVLQAGTQVEDSQDTARLVRVRLQGLVASGLADLRRNHARVGRY